MNENTQCSLIIGIGITKYEFSLIRKQGVEKREDGLRNRPRERRIDDEARSHVS